MTIKGFPSGKKLNGTTSEFVTVQDLGCDKRGLDTTTKFLTRLHVPPKLIVSATSNQIEITSHGAEVGDVLKFETGNLIAREFGIIEIIDADNFLIATIPDVLPTAGDNIFIMRYLTQRCSTDGSQIVTVSAAPIQFQLDGFPDVVTKDTGTPANNKGLPVELVDTLGVVDIRAKLLALLAELQLKADLTETQPVSLATQPLPTGASTEATLAAMSAKIVSSMDDCVGRLFHDYAVPVTTGAYVQISAGLGSDVKEMEIFDTSGSLLIIATGNVGAEVDKAYIMPGGNGRQRIKMTAGTKVSLKAVDTNAVAGLLAINLYN